ncbi:MAG: hypothetical protein N2484_15665 [Clostridia bacterium]|nr:hypothetical protein [Clostridia bacterium]
MVFEYSIVGGILKIHKSVFVQEMLVKDSKLRVLLNWKTMKDLAGKHPLIGGQSNEDIITVDFSHMTVDTQESPKDILNDLKIKYREKIKGKIAFRTVYGMFGGVFSYEVDLNSEDGEIKYISG